MKNILLDEAIQLTDDEGRSFEKDNAALKYYFNKFNQDYFGGVLEPIQLGWIKATKLHGYFRPRIKLKERKFTPVHIMLNINACGTYAAFRNVFVHEMLHYYVDCYTELPEANWKEAIRCAEDNDETGCKRALRSTPETCHLYTWKQMADELSEKYPELGNIEKYAVKNTETGVALMDKDYIVQWATKNVMLRQEFNNYVYYHILSINSNAWSGLQEMLKARRTYQKPFAGKWTRLYSTLEPKDFVQLTVARDMTKPLRRIPQSMIRKEKELGYISYDVENASKSGLSREEINKWCENVRVFCKDKRYVYFLKRGSKAYRTFMQAISTGKAYDIDLDGTWEEFTMNRDPRYFVQFSTNAINFNSYYNIDRILSKPNFITSIIDIGTIDVEFKVYEPGQYRLEPID